MPSSVKPGLPKACGRITVPDDPLRHSSWYDGLCIKYHLVEVLSFGCSQKNCKKQIVYTTWVVRFQNMFAPGSVSYDVLNGEDSLTA